MNDNHAKEIAGLLVQIIPAIGLKIIKPTSQLKSTMSVLQINILSFLDRTANNTMSSLSKGMNMSNQQMSAVVNQLEDDDLVIREHNQLDRRIVNISITSAGKRALKESQRNYVKMIAKQIQSISEEDYAELSEVLTRLKDLVERINMEPDEKQ